MADDKVYLPSGTGGLIRYFDDYKSPFSITPETVILICGAVVLFELFLKYGVRIS